MLELEEVVNRLQDRNLTRVAEQTGLSVQTVWRVKAGKAQNLTISTLSKLSDYLEMNL